MLRLINLFIFIVFFINSCGYPDIDDIPIVFIDDIPEDSDLEITYKDEENIKKLKEQINEFISCRDSNNPEIIHKRPDVCFSGEQRIDSRNQEEKINE